MGKAAAVHRGLAGLEQALDPMPAAWEDHVFEMNYLLRYATTAIVRGQMAWGYLSMAPDRG